MIITVSAARRRARLVARHRLAPAAGSVAEAVESMIALHGTDPVTVYLSAWARTGCGADDVDEAIYNERVLVRMLGMRRTMFVVPADLVPVVQAACTDDVAKRLRRQLEKDLGVGGVGDGDPTVWWAGRVVGGWAQRPSGEIVCRLLEDLGADGADAVSREADRLEAWLGANRVTPRFRTPLERELSA